MFLRAVRRRVQKMLIGTLLLSMLLPTSGAAAVAMQVTDIADSYAQKEIQSLVDQGIVSGYEDSTFQPTKAMSRAELAKILVLSLGLKENKQMAAIFQDLDPQGWYTGYVGALVQSGITSGTSDTTFSPDERVTREQLVVFFLRAMGLEVTASKLPVDAELSDLMDVADWARAAVSLAFKIGFVGGEESSSGSLRFNPKQNAERQALARLAYEFVTNKDKFEAKAKELVNASQPTDVNQVSQVSAVSSTSVEVAFTNEVTMVNADEFSFDNGLKVVKAELKTGSKTVLVLTTDAQKAGTVYKLSYKGIDTGKTFTAAPVPFAGGGGFGGPPFIPVVTKTDVDKLNSGGTYDSLTITSSGLIGPANGAAKTKITGTLTLDPGSTGEIKLQNVDAETVKVASGSSNSIKLLNTTIRTLRIQSSNQATPTRIESLEGSNVTTTDVQSKAIIESSAGSLGVVTIGAGANHQEVEIRGNIQGSVNVQGDGTQIKIAAPAGGGTTTIANLNIGSQATVTASPGTTLKKLNVTSSHSMITLEGGGQIQAVTVNPEAEGSTLTLNNPNITSIAFNANATLSGDASTIGALLITKAPNVVISTDSQVHDTLRNNAITAINAISDFTGFTPEVDGRITAADTLANNAILLGVSASEITGYSTKLQAAKLAMAGYALEAVKRDLAIGFNGYDSADAVTQNLTLPLKDSLRGTNITWTSSHTSLIDENGKVTRPAAGAADAVVTLTAKLSRFGQESSVSFTVTVLAIQSANPNLNSITIDPSSITFFINGQTTQLVVTAHFSNGTTAVVSKDIKFVSSVPAVAAVSEDGLVTAGMNGSAIVAAMYGGKTAAAQVSVEPLVLTGSSGNGTAVLSWNSVGAGASYQIFCSTESGYYPTQPIIVTGTTYTFSGLNNGEEYYFRISSVVNDVVLTSNQVSAIPAVVPLAKTATPNVTGTVYTNGWIFSGSAEPGDIVYPTELYITDKYGKLFSIRNAQVDGKIDDSLNTSWISNLIFKVGDELQIVAQAKNKLKSDPVKFVVQATSGQTSAPIVLENVYETSYEINGYTEPGSIVNAVGKSYNSSVVYNDRKFTIYIGGPNKVGDKLQLTSTQIGKGPSEPLTITFQEPPKTVLASVTSSVYTNGYYIAGQIQAEGGTYVSGSVQLTGRNGSFLEYIYVNPDGTFKTFSVVRNGSFLNLTEGEEFHLSAQRKGWRSSDTVTFVVQKPSGQTDSPSVFGNVYERSDKIVGHAEPGAIISLESLPYSFVSTTQSDSAGIFEFNKGPFTTGQELLLKAVKLGKEISTPARITVQSPPQTKPPTVTGAVYTNGYRLSGTAELTYYFTTTQINLSKRDGTVIASSSVQGNGKFTLENINNNVALIAGEDLLLTAQASGQPKSDPVIITVQAPSAKTAPVIMDFYNEVIISGWAEVGSKVYVKNLTNKEAYAGYFTWASPKTGTFIIQTNPLDFKVGDEVEVTSVVFGQATSDPVRVIIKAAETTQTPTVSGIAYVNGLDIQGMAEQGSTKYGSTYINVLKKGPNYYTYVESISVTPDGTYSLNGLTNPNLILAVGDELHVIATAAGKKTSEPMSIFVQATSGQTAAPTVEEASEVSIRGKAEKDAIITIQSSITGRLTTRAIDGAFTLNHNNFFSGDTLTITATTIGKATSAPVTVRVAESPTTATPTVTGVVYTNAFMLAGIVEPATPPMYMYSMIWFSDPDDVLMMSFSANSDGSFSSIQDMPSHLTLSEGETISVRAQAYNKKMSAPVKLTVIAPKGKTAQPDFNDNDVVDGQFTGTAEPGAIVILQNDSTEFTKSTTSALDGTYKFTLPSEMFHPGNQLTLTAIVLGKETSDPVHFTLLGQ